MEKRAINKKRTVILLRSVVAISTSYLILFGEFAAGPASVGYILAFIVSNVLLARTPKEWFHEPRFSAALLLGDTAVVLIGLYLTVGCFSQDFLIIYFFTIFLTTATEGIAQIAVGTAMVSGLYGYWLWLTSAHALGAGEWLRLPFLFIVAVFYGYVTEETKQEHRRRQLVEHESTRLRWLLEVSEAFLRRGVNEQWLRRLAGLVEAAFPRLECQAHVVSAESDSATATAFPVQARDRTFGILRVAPKDHGALSPGEEEFCQVVATIAANALYSAEQAGAAQDGVSLKQEFLSTLSHELRTPLNVILGNADIIAEEVQGVTPFVRDSIDRLRASALHLTGIIEELLCLTELCAGHAAVYAEHVNLQDLFHEFGTGMQELLGQRPIRFECDIGADVPAVYTDRRQLRMIIRGLLANAAKFTESGFVRLSAQRLGGETVEIAVQDSGMGIDPTNLAQIFQQFRQVDGSPRRQFYGLGLALTQELAGALGGQVYAESLPKCGSTFRLRLPLRNGSDSPRAAPRAAALAVPLRGSQLPSAA